MTTEYQAPAKEIYFRLFDNFYKKNIGSGEDYDPSLSNSELIHSIDTENHADAYATSVEEVRA